MPRLAPDGLPPARPVAAHASPSCHSGAWQAAARARACCGAHSRSGVRLLWPAAGGA